MMLMDFFAGTSQQCRQLPATREKCLHCCYAFLPKQFYIAVLRAVRSIQPAILSIMCGYRERQHRVLCDRRALVRSWMRIREHPEYQVDKPATCHSHRCIDCD